MKGRETLSRSHKDLNTSTELWEFKMLVFENVKIYYFLTILGQNFMK
jgi:hypothetical protein